MIVRRANSFHPVSNLRSEMDQLVNDFFGPRAHWAGVPARGFPALNVWEVGDDVFVEAEVPGVKSDDIDISVIGSDLTIRGHRQEQQSEGAAHHRRERAAGEFTRVLRLPIEVDANHVEASLRDGVLLVKLSKAESAKPKKIKVNPAA